MPKENGESKNVQTTRKPHKKHKTKQRKSKQLKTVGRNTLLSQSNGIPSSHSTSGRTSRNRMNSNESSSTIHTPSQSHSGVLQRIPYISFGERTSSASTSLIPQQGAHGGNYGGISQSEEKNNSEGVSNILGVVASELTILTWDIAVMWFKSIPIVYAANKMINTSETSTHTNVHDYEDIDRHPHRSAQGRQVLHPARNMSLFATSSATTNSQQRRLASYAEHYSEQKEEEHQFGHNNRDYNRITESGQRNIPVAKERQVNGSIFNFIHSIFSFNANSFNANSFNEEKAASLYTVIQQIAFTIFAQEEQDKHTVQQEQATQENHSRRITNVEGENSVGNITLQHSALKNHSEELMQTSIQQRNVDMSPEGQLNDAIIAWIQYLEENNQKMQIHGKLLKLAEQFSVSFSPGAHAIIERYCEMYKTGQVSTVTAPTSQSHSHA